MIGINIKWDERVIINNNRLANCAFYGIYELTATSLTEFKLRRFVFQDSTLHCYDESHLICNKKEWNNEERKRKGSVYLC